MAYSVEFDAHLVALLTEDGRASYRELARRIGASRSLVAKRMHELTAAGDLSVVAVRHPQISGANERVHLSIHVRSAITPVVERLVEHPATQLVTTTAGAHNITVECRLESQDELNDVYACVRSAGDLVQMSVTRCIKLIKGPYGPPAGETLTRAVDTVDLRLLDLLSDDARTPFVILAEHVGMSPSAVRRRVESLVADSAVRFVPVARRRGDRRHPTLGFGVNGTGDHDALQHELLQLESLEYLVHTIGRYDFIGTLIAPTTWDLATGMSQLCAIEPGSQVRTWLHLAVHKENPSQYGWFR